MSRHLPLHTIPAPPVATTQPVDFLACLRPAAPGPAPERGSLGAPFLRDDPTDPFRGWTVWEIEQAIHAVLADWSDPSLSVAALCRKHQLDLFQLHALSQRPAFRRGLARQRAAHEARMHDSINKALEQARRILGPEEVDAMLAQAERRQRRANAKAARANAGQRRPSGPAP